jgi:hypothetical protein
MPELLLANRITNPISKSDLQIVKTDYIDYLNKQPFPQIKSTDYPSVLSNLKRETFSIGPYTGITVFEAANRIASDLTLIEGVLNLFKKKFISHSATVKLLLGTMQVDNKGDFSIFDNGSELQGEAFDVAPTFFKAKLYKTITKWGNDKFLKYIIFNQDCLNDPKCNTYLKNQQKSHPGIGFIGVKSWHK